MEAYRLQFPNRQHAELTLGTGVHGIGRTHSGDVGDRAPDLGLVEGLQASLLQFCVDRRGVWMTVSDEARGVHVNGRPVRCMAMLRSGDTVFVDGVEMVLVTAQGVEAMPLALHHAVADVAGDPRVLLRGIGGQHHGRSFTLEQPRMIGRSNDADIRIEDPAIAERHVRIELHEGQVVLRDLGSADGSLVNGQRIRDALLNPGDQLVLDGQHRFVLEAPDRGRLLHALQPEPDPDESAANQAAAAWSHSVRRLPWLLLAAMLLATALAALMLFGGH